MIGSSYGGMNRGMKTKRATTDFESFNSGVQKLHSAIKQSDDSSRKILKEAKSFFCKSSLKEYANQYQKIIDKQLAVFDAVDHTKKKELLNVLRNFLSRNQRFFNNPQDKTGAEKYIAFVDAQLKKLDNDIPQSMEDMPFPDISVPPGPPVIPEELASPDQTQFLKTQFLKTQFLETQFLKTQGYPPHEYNSECSKRTITHFKPIKPYSSEPNSQTPSTLDCSSDSSGTSPLTEEDKNKCTKSSGKPPQKETRNERKKWDTSKKAKEEVEDALIQLSNRSIPTTLQQAPPLKRQLMLPTKLTKSSLDIASSPSGSSVNSACSSEITPPPHAAPPPPPLVSETSFHSTSTLTPNSTASSDCTSFDKPTTPNKPIEPIKPRRNILGLLNPYDTLVKNIVNKLSGMK